MINSPAARASGKYLHQTSSTGRTTMAKTEKSDSTKRAGRIFSADRLSFLPPLIAGMYRLLHRTCTFTVLGREHDEAAWRVGPPVLYTSWHFAFPAVIYHFRDRNGMLMVSRSRDGEWAAQVVKRLGYQSFRGSPGKGGSAALRQLIAAIKSAQGGGFIADGSQGPRRIAQKGILLLARYTRAPLVPVSMAANPCWRFNSWDRTVVAKPFSHVAIAMGRPLVVDKDVSSDRLEEMREELQDVLNRLTEEAEEAVGY
jgi:lysophospholipid acyltransferase (LPLAT)-like uncharacterized protein